MLKDFIFAVLRPFLNLYIRLRYRDFWALKKHLQTHRSKLLELCYTHHFMALGSFIGLKCHLENTPYFPTGHGAFFSPATAASGGTRLFFSR